MTRSDSCSLAPRSPTPTSTARPSTKTLKAALLARPEEILDLQRDFDEDTRDVLHAATERMDILLRDKSHFLHKHDTLTSPAKVPMIQQKKDLLTQFLQQPEALRHKWIVFRSGVKCGIQSLSSKRSRRASTSHAHKLNWPRRPRKPDSRSSTISLKHNTASSLDPTT